MSGNAFMGRRVIGLSVGMVSMRVMHMRRGLPLISAEQEPHLPALQFQRHARSLACVAWIWWIASRTTIPSETSVGYSTNFPCVPSPRQTLKVAFAMVLLHLLDNRFQLRRDRLEGLVADLHLSVVALERHYIELREVLNLVGMVLAEMSATAFLPLDRGARDGF